MNGRKIIFALMVAAILVGTVATAAGMRNGNRMIAAESRRAEHLDRLQTVLGDAGVPLDPGQIAAIEALVPGPENRGALGDILTEAQKEALRAARPERNRSDGDGPGGRRPHRPGIGKVLEDAGIPLSDAQITAIRDLERGEDRRVQVEAILSPDQLAALEAAAEARRAEHLEHLQTVLGDAGVPLDPGQIAAIEALVPGPENRGALGDILTDAQKEALRAARPERNRSDGDGPDQQGETMTDPIGTEKTTGVTDDTPAAFTVGNSYPNPFNPSATIDYTLAEGGNIRVEVFNQEGQRIDTLVSGWQSAGPHTVVWNASQYAAGVYLCRFSNNGYTETRKMTLVK